MPLDTPQSDQRLVGSGWMREMFLDIVQHKQNEPVTGLDAQKSEQRKRQKLLFQLGFRQGWKVLVVGPGDDEELTLLARLVGSRGELVIVDSEGDCLERIEASKQNGAYQVSTYGSRAIHPAFIRPQKVDVPVFTLVFNGRSLDFPDDTFDAVWCAGMIGGEMAVAPETLIHEFHRVVRPDGIIAIYQPS